MIKNPFPGPQPYRSSDRKLFYGRDDLARKLEAVILASRCITVHGPSGAGKSSLVQAAVLPALVESRDVRIVRVDAWPEGEAPDWWLAQAVFSNLRMGNPPADQAPAEAVLGAAKRAARASDRLLIVYLDQMEQLFFAGRSSDETELLFVALQGLVDLPIRSLRVVLSLREDYLGRFRDRVRDRGRLLENTFRVGPLTVEELTAAVCQAAQAGEPPQTWSFEVMRTLMLQVRVPGQAATNEAEAQAAYAQIVCRALFQERANGPTSNEQSIKAEPIVRRYFDSTLSSLGNLEEPAQRLLEDHLITADGSRTLRTEAELLRILPKNELYPILEALEGAAILHAEEHQGSRYFELGHDWLARKVFEERGEREAHEAARKNEEEMQRQLEEQQRVAAERLEKARKERKRLVMITGGALVFSLVTSVQGLYAWKTQKAAESARRQATKAQLEAVRKRIEASDQRLIAGYVALTSQGQQSNALKVLAEVKFPAIRQGWLSLASDALSENLLRVTLIGHTGPLVAAKFSPDGQRILTAASDGVARIWNADGKGAPILLTGHKDAILSAAWSPDGKRILTTSADGTAHVWNADGKGPPAKINWESGPIWTGIFSADGKRIALGAQDGSVRIVANDGRDPIELELGGENPGGLRTVAFFPDNRRVLGAANNGSLHLWDVDTHDKPTEIGEHDNAIESLTMSEDGTQLLVAAGGSEARLYGIQGKKFDKPRLLSCDLGQAIHSAFSPDGSLVAISCNDRRVRVYSTKEEQSPIILEGATGHITDLEFRPDGKFIAIASQDAIARVHSVLGGPPRLELRGHIGAIGSLSFRPDGKLLVTAASDERARDDTAKIWDVTKLDSFPELPRTPVPHHSVAIRQDGEMVAAAFDDNVIRVRRVDGQGDAVVLQGHEGWISRVAWAPDGARIVSASFDTTARVWNADGTGEPIVLGGKANDGHTDGVRHAGFSQDGKLVVTASEDHTAKVWHADRADKPIVTLRGHDDWVTWAVFTHDGKKVATGSQDKKVRLFSLDKPKQPVTFDGHRGPINSIKFSPKDHRLASASDDGTVRIVSTDGSHPPVVLVGNGTGSMQFVVWSSDGRRIAAASSDHLVYLWDADGKTEPSVLTPPQNVIALHFMDQDRTLMAVFADGSSREWRIDVPALVDALRTANADCLPVILRKRYFEEDDKCAHNAYQLCESDHARRPKVDKDAACENKSAMLEFERLTALVAADAQEEGSQWDWLSNWWRPPNKPPPIADNHDIRSEQKSLVDLGPDGCHVRVVVVPGDADVEVDGKPVLRKDGAVELLGKRGDIVRLRVSKPGQYIEVDVKIEELGAVPPIVVMPPRAPAKKEVDGGKR